MKAQLHILKGQNQGQQVTLDQDRTSLGRNPDCHVVIPITSVSREHAQILHVQGKYFIEDLQSRNGTYVNNQPITGRTALKDNDRIRICDFLAVFKDATIGVWSAAEVLQALAAENPEESAGVQVLYATGSGLGEEECQRIRETLETNHVFYDRAEVNGLHHQLLKERSLARTVLGRGFHRLVVLDAERGLEAGQFDLPKFLRCAHDEMVRTFGLQFQEDTYHAENIAQLLKDEPRSLFCFVNLQHVPIRDLRRLRGFTQELHQALFLCCGTRNLVAEERTYEEEEEEPGSSSSTTEATLSHSSHLLLESQPAEKLRALLDISGNLSKTLELDPLLPKIVDSLFTLFKQADRGFIILSEEGPRGLLPKVVKTRRPQDQADARFSRAVVRQCIETGQAFLSDDASTDKRIALSQSVLDFRIRSVMCGPLMSGDGKAFGVIQLDTQDRSKKFTQEDLKLLVGVCNQVSIALENAKLHETLVARERLKRDLELACQVQHSFLPKELPQLPGYEFYAHYESAQEVGGDYYGFTPLANSKVAITVGDVAGKGIPASLLMAKLSSDTRFSLLTESDPAKALAILNNLLYPHTSPMDRFVTLVTGILDPATGTVTLASAGHQEPLLYRKADGSIPDSMPKDVSGLPLGIIEDAEYASCQITLQPGDCLLLFSDGVPDAVNVKNQSFGNEGIKSTIQTGGYATAKPLGERLVKAVKAFAAGRPQHDDITLVCVSRDAPG